MSLDIGNLILGTVIMLGSLALAVNGNPFFLAAALLGILSVGVKK
jgi:hypothetical protein